MITNQAYLFLIFVINGVIIGILFDFFRILRKSFKTPDFVTYIEDVIFWILTGLLTLYSIFVFNNGEIRFFMFLGIFIGIALYMLLCSTYIIKFSVFIINKTKKIILKIFNMIAYPIKLIYRILKKVFINVKNMTQKTTKIINKTIKNTKSMKKM